MDPAEQQPAEKQGAIDKRPSSKINRKLQPITEDIIDDLPEVNSAVPKMQLHFCYNIIGLISFNWVILTTSKKSNNCVSHECMGSEGIYRNVVLFSPVACCGHLNTTHATKLGQSSHCFLQIFNDNRTVGVITENTSKAEVNEHDCPLRMISYGLICFPVFLALATALSWANRQESRTTALMLPKSLNSNVNMERRTSRSVY
uniref:Uncharacterized protein n=1 Tax=Glossina pallidipes TaxID=7398 RepID=A0A1A9ZXL1_GLOPL